MRAVAVVAMARLIGAHASEVAALTAARLNAEVVDGQLNEEVARRLGMETSEVEEFDESLSSRLTRLLRHVADVNMGAVMAVITEAWEPRLVGSPTLRDPEQAIALASHNVIQELIRKGNVVIIGRGATLIARDNVAVLRVLVWAETEYRIATMAGSQLLDHNTARRRVAETDAKYKNYVRHFYGADLTDISNYDLVIDTSRVPPPLAAEMIAETAQRLTTSRASGGHDHIQLFN